MAIKCVKSRYEAEQGKWIKDFVMDGEEDLGDLPVNVGAGSTAHCAGEEGELIVFEMLPGGTWEQIA